MDDKRVAEGFRAERRFKGILRFLERKNMSCLRWIWEMRLEKRVGSEGEGLYWFYECKRG